MSLNGLDDPKVKEAHDTASAEPGGWFLLKYSSRDEIELLDRGNGGIVEIRNVISQYKEKSPLFGFLRYRRRNVIIKYLPEGCSRLVQARLSVHFNAVCERFVPHDTTFDITEAKDLKDTKLSAACSLHAASGSTSSSTSSLRRRRLMEIAEEEEEEQRATKRQSIVQEESPRSPSSRPSSPPPPQLTLNSDLASLPDGAKFSSSQDPPTFVGAVSPSSPSKATSELEPRLSSQSTRPDLYSSAYSIYGKPKVKLGPRPSLDNRPQTAGNYRPISALPAGFKIFSSKRGKSRDKNELLEEPIQEALADMTFDATTLSIPEAPPTPKSTEMPRPRTSGAGSSDRPSTSSGISVKSFKMSSGAPSIPSAKENKITPEKARLMKALQLREKKKRMAAEAQAAAQEDVSTPTTPMTPGAPDTDAQQATDYMSRPTDKMEIKRPDRLSVSKADSGIAIDLASPATDVVSDDTQTDSLPTSPIGDTSEVGLSTKPSSLSESTDETVEAPTTPKGVDAKADPSEDAVDAADAADVVDAVDVGATRGAEVQLEPSGETQVDRETPTAVVPEENAGQGQQEVMNATTEHKSAIETEATQQHAEHGHEESNSNASTTPVSPETEAIALPVSKFSTRIPATLDHDSAGMEANIAEATTPEASRPASAAFRLPVSKFSTQDAAPSSYFPSSPISPSAAAATADVPDVSDTADTSADEVAINPTESAHDDDTVSPLPESQAGPKILSINTARIDIEPLDQSSVGHLSVDDELTEELQSATLQEATPVSVSKSPITPAFPGPPKDAPGGEDATSPGVNRTASNPTPLRGPVQAPVDVTQSTARSVSSGAAFLHKMSQQQGSSSLAPKTGKMGSSISQRIKALEKINSHNGSTESLQIPSRHPAPSSTFFSVRKNSASREPSRSPSVLDRAALLTPSREHSPEAHRASQSRDRAGSVASRLSMFEKGGGVPQPGQTPALPPSRGRTESIQVTARIVRDPGHPYPEVPELNKDPSDYTPVDLKQSPLVVDVHKIQAELDTTAVPPAPEVLPTPEVPKETIQERRLSRDKRRSMSTDRGIDASAGRRSSLSIVKDFIMERRNSIAKSPNPETLLVPSSAQPSRSPSRPPSTHHNTFSPRRLSLGSRRSSMEVQSPPNLLESSPSVSGDVEDKDKKTKNRASRFIRRLSASLSGSRKNLTPNISPTVREEDDASEAIATDNSDSRASPTTQQSIAAFMGEVNVQFPDTLLWKRRSMCLDAHGFLLITTIQGQTAEKVLGSGVKRYHLSEFRMPYIPDVEVQELPNSVVLDFVDGSGLQVACEDRPGQLNVLHILQDAHQNHTSFGQ